MSEQGDHLSLKWGTLKSWRIHTDEQRDLLRRYYELGASMSAMLQRDTPEQKDIICRLIDLCGAPTIYLDWDDKDVSKEDAKQYVMNYGVEMGE